MSMSAGMSTEKPYTVGEWVEVAQRYKILYRGRFHDLGPVVLRHSLADKTPIGPAAYTRAREMADACNRRWQALAPVPSHQE